MTTVNDFTDILRIIRERPEWGDALRSALLSQKLLELPERFAEFTESANKRFAALESDVAELKGGQARLEGSVARLEGQVGNLRGNSHEQKIGNIISSIMSDRMDLLVRVLKRVNLDDDSEFFDLVHDAERRGIISRQERREVTRTDIVLQERRRPGGTAMYVVIEVSTTVADHDIIRSAERAAILERVTGAQTLPIVVGAHVDAPRQRLGQERNVTLIAVSE